MTFLLTMRKLFPKQHGSARFWRPQCVCWNDAVCNFTQRGSYFDTILVHGCNLIHVMTLHRRNISNISTQIVNFLYEVKRQMTTLPPKMLVLCVKAISLFLTLRLRIWNIWCIRRPFLFLGDGFYSASVLLVYKPLQLNMLVKAVNH